MLRLIRQFITENSDRLSSQLGDFEQNVANETDRLRAGALPQLVPISVTLSTVVASYTVGQAVECDMTLGSLGIPLAKPANGSSGLLAIVKLAAANTVTVTPIPPATINGATSKAYTAIGLALIYFDGVNFYG